MLILSLWRQFHELFTVLIITFCLTGLYYLGGWFSELTYNGLGSNSYAYYSDDSDLDPPPERPDISDRLSQKLHDACMSVLDWAVALSLITTPLAAYVSARNDRLTVPIRLLAAAENLNKFIFAFTFTGEWLCGHVSVDKKRWPKWLQNSLDFMELYLENTFDLTDIAMYCQLMISLNRFLAVSFDGLYFHIVRKSPLIQLAVPYLMRSGIACLDIYVPLELLSLWTIMKGYMITVPLFLMCGMDIVMSRRLKQLRQNGKASRAESLLMIQMISNSGVTALYFVAQDFVKGTSTIFYGLNVQFLVWDILELIRLSFLTFVTRAVYKVNFDLSEKPIRSIYVDQELPQLTIQQRIMIDHGQNSSPIPMPTRQFSSCKLPSSTKQYKDPLSGLASLDTTYRSPLLRSCVHVN